jgi:3-methylcrotonyl-CoA carboxylase alpha subunit
VRIDAGIAAGDTVGIHYDALLAKLIVVGADRESALTRLARALAACRIDGVTTNLAALMALAADPEVRAGRVFTRLIDERGTALLPESAGEARRAAILAALALLAPARSPPRSPWSCGDSWALNNTGFSVIRLQAAGEAAYVIRARGHGERWQIELDGSAIEVEDFAVTGGSAAPLQARARAADRLEEWSAHIEDERVAVWFHAEWYRFERVSAVADALAAAADGTVRAPMPGVILAVRVAQGERVARGQALIVMEAMKMEHTLSAGAAGIVTELRARAGERVRDGEALLKVSTAD